MAKRPPLSTGTVKSVRFDFAPDDDDFEDTPGDFIARIIAPKARTNLEMQSMTECESPMLEVIPKYLCTL